MLISPCAVFRVAAQTSVRTHARLSLLTSAPGPPWSAGTTSSAGQAWRTESLAFSGDDVDVCGETVLSAARVLKQSMGGVGFWHSAERLQTQVSVRAHGALSLARKTILFGAAPGLTAAWELLVVACGIWFPD